MKGGKTTTIMTWARDLFGEIHVVESHTAEPTRVVIGEGPQSRKRSPGGALQRFAPDHDFRSSVVNEPPGSHVLAGGLLADSDVRPGAFSSAMSALSGMYGHGTMAQIDPGVYTSQIPLICSINDSCSRTLRSFAF